MKHQFGLRLKSARLAAGYTQKELGLAVGIDGNSVARIERGEQGVRWNVLERIIGILGQPASYYFSTDVPLASRKATTDEVKALIRDAFDDPTVQAMVAEVIAAFAKRQR